VATLIHKDLRDLTVSQYVKRVLAHRMSKNDYATTVKTIGKSDCIAMTTPFDEKSVDWYVDFDLTSTTIIIPDPNNS
jgi:N-acetylneuraminate synthase